MNIAWWRRFSAPTGYTAYPDRPTVSWTPDSLGKGIFYIQRELNDRFTTVMT